MKSTQKIKLASAMRGIGGCDLYFTVGNTEYHYCTDDLYMYDYIVQVARYHPGSAWNITKRTCAYCDKTDYRTGRKELAHEADMQLGV